MKNIKEITIGDPKDNGFIAYTEAGESVFIIAEPVGGNGLKVGDKMIAVLVYNRYRDQATWFADWAVPSGEVSIETVANALDDLKEGGALEAGEIGLHEGDLLYRAGIATKYITLHKKKRIDSYKDIHYSVYPERIAIDEFEDDEE